MPNITDYMEVSPTGGSGINIKALFGQRDITLVGGSAMHQSAMHQSAMHQSQVGGSLDNDLYIPFGLYCSRGITDHKPKQLYAAKWLDDSLFDKLFDSVSANDNNKTQKTIPATKHQTKRRK